MRKSEEKVPQAKASDENGLRQSPTNGSISKLNQRSIHRQSSWRLCTSSPSTNEQPNQAQDTGSQATGSQATGSQATVSKAADSQQSPALTTLLLGRFGAAHAQCAAGSLGTDNLGPDDVGPDEAASDRNPLPIEIMIDEAGNLILRSDDVAALDKLEELMHMNKPPKKPYDLF